ncbi:Bug family tripartite tricarboxylate transporter substrate binding protein [Halomonas hibernica]|uniref:Bug family tripartite tricarboxylate transporter substrate binding protein n=1 Tax=Halomonas hibernica TaxID=2591147 RepID=UPI00155577E5|nr:tripartite tricarboxylate transporter substrate binding protein [Halomonas hibernica]
MSKIKKILLTAVIASLPATAALADNAYPERDIELIVPYSPGGGTDIFARTLQPKLEEALGGTIVIRNLSGGGGAVGYSRAVNAEPDGYTLVVPLNAIFTLQGLGNVNFQYDDFDYIARAIVEPYVLAVRNNDAWSSLADLMEYAKTNDQPITVGFAGVGSSTHVTAMAMGTELGIELRYIPFDGASKAVSAAMGGHIDAVVLNPSDIMSAVDSGRLVPLLSTGEARTEVLPEVPTMQELDYKLSLNQWRGFAAPKGVSPEIRDKWAQAVATALEDPAIQEYAKQSGLEINAKYGDELKTFVDSTANVMIPFAGKARAE